jgi:cytochrome c5
MSVKPAASHPSPIPPDYVLTEKTEITMSSSDQHDDHHEGPIKTPTQLLMTVLFSFVAPVFVIIGLVYFVTSAAKPASDADKIALGGITAEELQKGVARRIQKVGMVEIRDANRALKSGEEIYKAQCVTCHAAGVAGAPKLGDVGLWAARITTGYEALLNSALKGKGAMGAQGGGDYEDVEIGRAVVYMANSAGGKFAVPDRAAAPVAAASGAEPAAAVAAAPAAAASGTVTSK